MARIFGACIGFDMKNMTLIRTMYSLQYEQTAIYSKTDHFRFFPFLPFLPFFTFTFLALGMCDSLSATMDLE
ncbi:hypothetical protein Y032_0134g1815 [Ancylostoma ceylanicum]|uniref:Uncharacterized protein n=1 Tax=Ancylostoma ceylanicum TaxID=53326 RepID=A0A016T5Z7_9BILA|nr:hypothetical protein Y032_0134g1815 [Ancylostoma ceylanicum]